MTKKEKNEIVAELLGFKRHVISPCSKNMVISWKYPKKYEHLAEWSPMYEVPDFMQILEDKRESEINWIDILTIL